MKAKIKALWLILECPHCNRPNTKNKFVDSDLNAVVIKPFSVACDLCGKSFDVRLNVLSDDDTLYGMKYESMDNWEWSESE